MRLINVETYELETFADHRSTPEYAILSHTWGAEEVLFQDVQPVTDDTKKKLGWKKIEYTCRQAQKDELRYGWVDTCCIDKTSSAELSEAINSMFAWYKEAKICYAYLTDVDELVEGHEGQDGIPGEDALATTSTTEQSASVDSSGDAAGNQDDTAITQEEVGKPVEAEQDRTSGDGFHENEKRAFEDQFKASRWFTRGWTLQELIGPPTMEFYSAQWKPLGSLLKLAPIVAGVTNIPLPLLYRECEVTSYCAARRMSWASRRQTTRIEDQAYCLLGLFQVNMPLLYGERQNAFKRLQEEIIRGSGDISIFAWDYNDPDRYDLWHTANLLAPSPDLFAHSGQIRTIDLAQRASIAVRSNGIQASFFVASTVHGYNRHFYISLNCYDERYPAMILALTTYNATAIRAGYGHKFDLNLVRTTFQSALTFLRRERRLSAVDVTLMYASNLSVVETTPVHYLHFWEPSSKRIYEATLRDVFPSHHWDIESKSYEVHHRLGRRDVHSEAQAFGGFSLMVAPKTSALEKRQKGLNTWRIDVEWQEGVHAMRPDSLMLRCYPDDADEQQCHRYLAPRLARYFVPSPECRACHKQQCELFRRDSSSFRRIRALVFKGLGGDDALKFSMRDVPGGALHGDTTLEISVERRSSSATRLAQGSLLTLSSWLLTVPIGLPLIAIGHTRNRLVFPATQITLGRDECAFLDAVLGLTDVTAKELVRDGPSAHWRLRRNLYRAQLRENIEDLREFFVAEL